MKVCSILKKKAFSFFTGLVLFSAVVSAQDKVLDKQGDTSFWYNLKKQDVKQIGLANLLMVSDSLHFRFWMENQGVEIWTNDFKIFYGIISNQTEKVENNSSGHIKHESNKFYSNKVKIDSSTSREVYNIFIESGVFDLPTDSKIKGWQMGFDGEEFLLEKSTPTIYSFKTFWTPSAQKNLPEAAIVEKLSDKLKTKLDLKNIWKSFRKGLPKGCYKYGETMIECDIVNSSNPKKTSR